MPQPPSCSFIHRRMTPRGKGPLRGLVWSPLQFIPAGCLFAGTLLVGLSVGAQTERVRTMGYSSGIRIDERLRPDDEVVVIEKDDGLQIHFDRTPSVEFFVEYLVRLADVIVVIDVKEMSTVVVDERTWIRTGVAATVKEVFKQENRPVRVGGTLRFQLDGGAVKFGNVLVKTRPVPSVEVGRTYLVFGVVNPENGILFPAHAPVLVEGDTLVYSMPFEGSPDRGANPLNGYSMAKLAAQVRRLAR